MVITKARSSVDESLDVVSDRLIGARRAHAMRVYVIAKIREPVADGATLPTEAVNGARVLDVCRPPALRAPVVQCFGVYPEELGSFG